MITLKELFTNLAYGELTNISIGDVDGTVDLEDYNKLLTHVKLGLTDLHKRFWLRRGELTLQTYSFIEKYYLRPQFAVSNTASPEPIKYIEDISLYGMETFTGDVLKIEKVQDEHGNKYCLNDVTAERPAYTFDHDCIAVPYAADTPLLYIIYRADHRKLPDRVDHKTNRPENVILQIPNWAIEALQCYVAHRILTGMGAGNPERGSGSIYFNRYELLCTQAGQLNLDPDDNDTNLKLENRGWV